MKSLDISESIDSYTIGLYEMISEVANSLNLQFFVVGATARDLILERGFNIRPFRATEDIDLGIQLESWAEFEIVKNGLLETGKFKETRDVQRLLYMATHPVDIVPFGAISLPGNQIEWPPEHEIIMSVE